MSRFGRNESLERLQRNMSRLHSALATSQELADVLVTIDDDERKCNSCNTHQEQTIFITDDGGSIDSFEFVDTPIYIKRTHTFELIANPYIPSQEELPF